MSSSVASIHLNLFVSAIFVFYSITNFATSARTSPPSLIQQACSSTFTGFDPQLCIKVLQSQPQVVSATNLFDLSIAIIRSGITNATNTRVHVENVLNDPKTETGLKGALKVCKSSYDAIITSFKSALNEIIDDREYKTATYDLLIASTDYVQPCQDAVASAKIKDETILTGNKVARIFGLSAYEVVETLDNSKTPPPASVP